MYSRQKLTSALSHLLGILALTLNLSIYAAEPIKYGIYEIHYNAFNSEFIEPQIAHTYKLQRGKRLAMINIAVLKTTENRQKIPTTAFLSGTATNLLQQKQSIKFKKIDEGNAIYYIGQFGFSSDMPIRLAIKIQPDPNQPAYELNTEQRFYTED